MNNEDEYWGDDLEETEEQNYISYGLPRVRISKNHVVVLEQPKFWESVSRLWYAIRKQPCYRVYSPINTMDFDKCKDEHYSYWLAKFIDPIRSEI